MTKKEIEREIESHYQAIADLQNKLARRAVDSYFRRRLRTRRRPQTPSTTSPK